MRLKAILFDVDGTIAETEEAHRRAFNQAFAEAGKDWCWSVNDYRELLKVTGGKERIRHFVKTIGETASDEFVAKVHGRKNAVYAELVESGEAALRPGIARLIAEARGAGIQVAIATTTSRENLMALLDRHFGNGALASFDAVVTGEDVSRKKPDPEVYILALGALGVAADACVAIEDSRNGLLAADACGIPVLVTPSLYTSHEQFDGATLILADLESPPVDIDALHRLVAETSSVSVAS